MNEFFANHEYELNEYLRQTNDFFRAYGGVVGSLSTYAQPSLLLIETAYKESQRLDEHGEQRITDAQVIQLFRQAVEQFREIDDKLQELEAAV